MSTNISNVALSINAIRKATDDKEIGVVALSYALGDDFVWTKPLTALVGTGDNAVAVPFTLRDMRSPRINPETGKKMGGFMTAALSAVADAFGIEGGFSKADNTEFKRAVRLTGARIELGIDISRDADGFMILPAGEVFDLLKWVEVEETNADGSVAKVQREVPTDLGAKLIARVVGNAKLFGNDIDDDTALAQALALPVRADGKKHPIFEIEVPQASKLSDQFAKRLTAAGLDDWKPKGANNAQSATEVASPVAVFTDSVGFILTCLDEVLDPDSDEASVAPSDDVIALLVKLAGRIEEYIEGYSDTDPE